MSATRDLIYALVFFYAGFSVCMIIGFFVPSDQFDFKSSSSKLNSFLQVLIALVLVVLQLIARSGE